MTDKTNLSKAEQMLGVITTRAQPERVYLSAIDENHPDCGVIQDVRGGNHYERIDSLVPAWTTDWPDQPQDDGFWWFYGIPGKNITDHQAEVLYTVQVIILPSGPVYLCNSRMMNTEWASGLWQRITVPILPTDTTGQKPFVVSWSIEDGTFNAEGTLTLFAANHLHAVMLAKLQAQRSIPDHPIQRGTWFVRAVSDGQEAISHE